MVGDASSSLLNAMPSPLIVPSPPILQDRRPQSRRALPELSREWLHVRRLNGRLAPPAPGCSHRHDAPTPTVVRDRLSPGAELSSARSCDRFCLRGVRIFPARLLPPFVSPDVRIRRADYASVTAGVQELNVSLECAGKAQRRRRFGCVRTHWAHHPKRRRRCARPPHSKSSNSRVKLRLERFDDRPMNSVDFFVSQRSIVRAIFESQRRRSFAVGDAFAFISADETYAGKIIRRFSLGRANELCDRDPAIDEQRHIPDNRRKTRQS